jgi:Ca-activated chloride channel family protein
MKKILIQVVVLLVFLSSGLYAQSGGIKGTILDEKGQPLISATIQISSGGIVRGGTVTDFDGNYLVKPLAAGSYDVKIAYLGYVTELIRNVAVIADQTTVVNKRLSRPKGSDGKTELKEVTIRSPRYVKPLIEPHQPSDRTVLTAQEIEKMPVRDLADQVATAPGVQKSGRGDNLNLAGSRSENTLIIIDGIQQPAGSRAANLPPGSVGSISNRKGRVPARYGSATGGVSPTISNVLQSGAPAVPNNEDYAEIRENKFLAVRTAPLSTLSVDVDRAAYANVRRYLNEGQKPPKDAVRIEEMINYFDYAYPSPTGDAPVAIHTEVSDCPWNKQHRLLHIGLQARRVDADKLPPSNLVFLIDVSGSMQEPNKLPLVQSALSLLVDNLRDNDRVAIVVYAGQAGLVLPSTKGSNKQKILEALAGLQAGGSTAGGEGILLAYKTAQGSFVKGGNNRVIMATDGDFNVGVSSNEELEKLIVDQRQKGIFLTCLGFGMGNYKDDKMQILADKGNGNHAYIDNIQEARKTLVAEFGGTLFTVAKDVKAQIEFNPAKVQAYRLIGYENRLLNTEDFKDDKKDAGEMGAGHTVTMLYEIVPVGVKDAYVKSEPELKYQQTASVTRNETSGELATVKFRYKEPDGDRSKELVHPISDQVESLTETSPNLRFSASVALFGMLLRDSQYKEEGKLETVVSLAESARGDDREGYRAEFIRLAKSVR